MNLFALEDYVEQARVLLQDTVASPYRYDNESLVTALNNAMYEISRLRPDILIDGKYRQRSIKHQRLNADGMPLYTVGLMDDLVPIPPQYKIPVLYYIVGFVQLRDNEETQDSRASALLTRFIAQLTTLQA